MPADIAKLMEMPHLMEKDDSEELKQIVEVDEKIKKKESEEKEGKADPKEAVEYTFKFEHKGSTGTMYSGLFTNKVLTVGEKMKVSALFSRLNDGIPVESIPYDQAITNKAIAHLAYSLKEKAQMSPANWANNLREMFEVGPILALYEEVASHEATFLGYNKTEEEG